MTLLLLGHFKSGTSWKPSLFSQGVLLFFEFLWNTLEAQYYAEHPGSDLDECVSFQFFEIKNQNAKLAFRIP